MRGVTAAERRSEQLQSLTSIGLLADNVALATIHYPNLSEAERRALESMSKLLDVVGQPKLKDHSAFPRRKSMSDSTSVLAQAAAAVEPGHSTPSTQSVHTLRSRVLDLLGDGADDSAVATVRRFAETLGRVTLQLAEGLANEKGVDDWIQGASRSYAA